MKIKLGAHWNNQVSTQNYSNRKESKTVTRINDAYEFLHQAYKKLGDVPLAAIISNFREHEGMQINDSFFAKDLEINAWSRVRRRFQPEEKTSWKTGVLIKDPIPINSL